MKDLPHHRKKLVRQTIRSVHREETAEEQYNVPLVNIEKSDEQKRKQIKLNMKKERESHVPSDKTPEEQNKEMKDRPPIFRPFSHKTK